MALTYIVGYDGSDASRSALRFATRLAASSGAEVVAAAVYRHSARPSDTDAQGERLAALASRSKAGAEEALATADLPDVVHCAVGASSPPAGLHRLAADQDAALLVVGVTHRGPLGRLVPGSVGERLLQGAPCPVAVVPATWSDAAITSVAVAYDRSDESQAALGAGEALARRLGARLLVLAVHEPLLASAGAEAAVTVAELDGELRDELVSTVNEIAGRLSPDVDAQGLVLDGAAGPALVDACTDGVDLLITGSRGYGPARSVLLGSVSRHLVDHAPCPVIVIPRGVGVGADGGPLTR